MRAPSPPKSTSGGSWRLWLATLGTVAIAVLSPAPAVANTYTVDTLVDANPGSCIAPLSCSLRAAIAEANAAPGLDTIAFDMADFQPIDAIATILLSTELPEIIDPVVIDGTTQPGFAGTPIVALCASPAVRLSRGLLVGTADSIVRGLAISGFERAIKIEGDRNVVEGSLLGGSFSFCGGNRTGVEVHGSGNTIGGVSPAARNVIAANSVGIEIHGSGNFVQGNSIRANGNGVWLWGGGNVVGGATAGARNVISGNRVGIDVLGSANRVEGNFVGLDATGSPLGNTKAGIRIRGPSAVVGAIGTVAAQAACTATCNVISGNGGPGVLVTHRGAGSTIAGNFVGTDEFGASAAGNAGAGVTVKASRKNVISGNLLSANGNGLVIEGDGSHNVVRGNRIGTNAAGTAALGNAGNGVRISLSEGTIVGGTGGVTPNGDCTGSCNVISANGGAGILLAGAGPGRTRLLGNFVGTSVNGTASLGNKGHGISILSGARENEIGGLLPKLLPKARNVISGNLGSGISIAGAGFNIVNGNFVGTDTTGSADLGNAQNGIVVESGHNRLGTGAGTSPGGLCTRTCNLIAGNSGAGIAIAGAPASSNVVLGNFVGVEATGSAPLPNGQGIWINNAPRNTVGGNTPQLRNVVSGNSTGILIVGAGAESNVLQGNYVGTDSGGTQAVANGIGVGVVGAPRNEIGGRETGASNLISGNNSNGVELIGATATSVRGNFIGAAASGTAGLGNAGRGILIAGGSGNSIGGSRAPGSSNVIAFNQGAGVEITGSSANPILSNSIFSNGELGIDLRFGVPTPFKVNPNDVGDFDTGANELQNFPVVNQGSPSAAVSGNLDSKPSTMYLIELFENTTCDPSGHGEGARFLDSVAVTTDGSGNANFSTTVPVTASAVVTATATDPGGNTSEFSPCR
jgi:CSLREA domain-containing protein